VQTILVIDDDFGYLKSIDNFLSQKKFNVISISNPLEAANLIKTNNFDCILCDVRMPGLDGISLLKQIQLETPLTPVVMVSGQSTISIAVEAIQRGAYDFIEKGSDPDRLLVTIENAISKKCLTVDKKNLLSEIAGNFQIIGTSKIMDSLFDKIRVVAPTDAKVLIRGETGTGKELIARAVHFGSPRNAKPFIKVNCAAIPENLLESELFGHKKGSYTGAYRDQIGKFQAADGGTLFLDEIGDLNIVLQAKMLRVLQDNEIEIIGENKPKSVDVRIICATNRSLEAMVESREFREDLYHRIKVVTFEIPPLRERKDDIPVLAKYFLQKNSEQYNKNLTDFSRHAMSFMLEQDWKGNVRELKNFIEKVSIFSKGPIVHFDDILNPIFDEKKEELDEQIFTLKSKMEKYEKKYIIQSLYLHNGKVGKTAEYLEIERTTLFKKMQKYKITKDELNTINC